MSSSPSPSPKVTAGARPKTLRPVKSFPRPEVQDRPLSPTRSQRASTIQTGAPPEITMTGDDGLLTEKIERVDGPDAFERGESLDDTPEPPRVSVDLNDLPIELISLTDSFIDSLSAKNHPTPPNIDNISQLFQDFYASAAAHINTHINSLISRQSRDPPLSRSVTPRASAASLLRAKATSLSSKERVKTQSPKSESEQQMLTAEELADRKKARRTLELKKGYLEEAVERRLCEGIYNRIYRHHSTQDEAQDDKLRSKTAALAVVGIGPADLGIHFGDSSSQTPQEVAEKEKEISAWLNQARTEMVLMHESRYPLGKLNRLKAVHKSIVDTLSRFSPSASADEIMPMLIYTLITLPPEKLNVISDANFIQRFRWEPKLVGELAYCLTNLEAAIDFLQTVDLSTLRADEFPSGPAKTVDGSTMPKSETFPPAYSTPTQSTVGTSPSNATAVKPAPSPSGLKAAPQLRNRRLSELVGSPAQAFGAASDAVLNTADQGLKTVSNSLGESYKFLVGKLRERQDGPPGASGDRLVVPKTLDDARKLIGTPPPDDDASVSGASSTHGPEDVDGARGHRSAGVEEKMLNLIGGRKVSRDHSVDSQRSASSSKKVAFTEEAQRSGHSTPVPVVGTALPSSSNPALIDSVRNLSSSFNPMARIAGMGGNMIRGFGRTASTPTAPMSKDFTGKVGAAAAATAERVDLATAFPDIASALSPKQAHSKINPPVKRFMELQNPADLRIGEVLELLRDYRRLAGALKDMDAFRQT